MTLKLPPIDPTLRASDFDYDLPSDLIAQTPLANRDESRLLVLKRDIGAIDHSTVANLPKWLRPGDLLVVNNSRVLAARLRGRKQTTNANIELLLLRYLGDGHWNALGRPIKRLEPGVVIEFVRRDGDGDVDAAAIATVVKVGEAGELVVRLSESIEAHLDLYGEMPLPPYIRTRLDDQDRYQTVYASVPGSAAAPTAGLHLTPELRSRLLERSVTWAEVTLHVGLDTFRPMRHDEVAQHHIHQEWCEVPGETAAAIIETKRQGGRVIAVGTTAARTLETFGRHHDGLLSATPFEADTSLFITPGYEWTVVNGLLTNFHLPRSTLMLLVSALAGRDRILAAYNEAIARRYRFFSFGDAMLIV